MGWGDMAGTLLICGNDVKCDCDESVLAVA